MTGYYYVLHKPKVAPFPTLSGSNVRKQWLKTPHSRLILSAILSFELDPTKPRDINVNMYERLAQKYGMSIEKAKKSCRKMADMAREVGLTFNFDTLISTNTFDAHRLAMFAKKQGLMNDMTDRLLRAYYTDSKHIGDHATLIELAVEVGLNREEVAEMLASDDMKDDVRADEQEAEENNIRSIPFFLVNKKHAISGAQPTEAFVQYLQQIIEKDDLSI